VRSRRTRSVGRGAPSRMPRRNTAEASPSPPWPVALFCLREPSYLALAFL
jgi:hypothetical protein